MSRWGVVLVLCGLVGAARATEPDPESLLDLVPGNAVGAAVLRENALEQVRAQLADAQEEQRDLRDYLMKRVGLDLTSVRSAAVFVTSISPPQGAAILRMSATGKPKWPKSGQANGVAIYHPDEKVYAAVTKSGLVLGTEAGVRAAIAVSLGKAPAIGKDSRLALLGDADRNAELLIGVDAASIPDPSVATAATLYGIKSAVAAWAPEHAFLWVNGDPQKLVGARDTVKTLLDAMVTQAKQQRDKAVAGDNTLEGVGAIASYHGAKTLAQHAPRLDGDRLVMDFTFPKGKNGSPMSGLAGSAALVGVGAAIAIPAFMKYIRRSKTVEATMNVRKLYDGAVVYYEAHHAFPASTDWEPKAMCCRLPSGKCTATAGSFSSPTWKELSFSIDGGFYYQYRFTRTPQGFTVEARGDLDCNGKYSLFRRIGTLTPNGDITGGAGLYSQDEVE